MNATGELVELVKRLHAEGVAVREIYHEAIIRNAKLGRPVADPTGLVSEIVGPYTAPKRSREELDRDYQTWQPPNSWRRYESSQELRLLMPEQRRQDNRGRGLAGLVRDHGEQVVLDFMDLIRDLVAHELPEAIDYHLSKRKRG